MQLHYAAKAFLGQGIYQVDNLVFQQGERLEVCTESRKTCIAGDSVHLCFDNLVVLVDT